MKNPTSLPSKFFLPRRVKDFMQTESSSGLVMIFFAVLALIAANSSLSGWYQGFVNAPVSFGLGDSITTEALKDWVKDILMVLFFLVIGMELKREIREGFLAQRGQILLPLLAALGGMGAPALLYLIINRTMPQNVVGWAIPSATDIAFALCVLTLAGRGIPPAVKIFLLAIAIFDDLGAIVIIAAFYNHAMAMEPLLLALVGVMILAALNRNNVTRITPYMVVGVFLWFCFYHSGIHTTIAGVIVGMAIPMRSRDHPHHSPLNSAMHLLHGWVSFLVLPVFAFTSAGVSFAGMQPATLLEPLPLGIALGLFFGKQIGILGASWLAVKSGFASMPHGSSWLQLYAISVIAGVGFTMSLFIGMLAFSSTEQQELVKLGVIAGSLLSIIWGAVVLRVALRAKRQ